jgi:mannose-1-phosphate guanylyltransferase
VKLILLSGGSGKRLWPLSNDVRSKQFLKILPAPQGGQESMVQRIWRQLERAGLHETAHLVSQKAQFDMISSQLGEEVPIIVEPERRDTFAAIALAAVYLHDVVGSSRDEVVTVMPVDSYVEDGYFETLLHLAQTMRDGAAQLGLIGALPTYPSAKYGYIIPQAESSPSTDGSLAVSHFIEKPSEEAAATLIAEQQALWNCGVFAFRLGYMLDVLTAAGIPLQHATFLEQYGQLPKNSFDYEVVEKCARITVVPYTGYWKDLGTWNTLTEEMGTTLIGKGLLAEQCVNTHLINELDIPILLLGLTDTVVTASPDGILVADKTASQKLKNHVSQFTQRPMFEERRWGSYRVLDFVKQSDGTEVLTKRIRISAGKNLSYQYHHRRSEVWTVISGNGEMMVDGVVFPVYPGKVIEIPVGSRHGIRAASELEFIEVQMGSQLIEEDIIRLAMTWEEALTKWSTGG